MPSNERDPAVVLSRCSPGTRALPEEIEVAITNYVREHDVPQLKAAAMLFSNRQGYVNADESCFGLSFTRRESLGYVAGQAPRLYGNAHRVLLEVARRVPDFRPRTMLDYGSGIGSAVWACNDVWKSDGDQWGSPMERVVCVDRSKGMQAVNRKLLFPIFGQRTSVSVEWSKRLPRGDKFDLCIAAETLYSHTEEKHFFAAVDSLWEATADTLVLIEPPSEKGFRNIVAARQRILLNNAAHVLAPCPHDKQCPLVRKYLAGNNKEGCFHKQRYATTKLQRRVFDDNGSRNYADGQFCYVVLRRGARPTHAASTLTDEAMAWARIVRPPKKNGGHVLVDACSPNGGVYRSTATKRRTDASTYRFARKAKHGDLWPHVLDRLHEIHAPMDFPSTVEHVAAGPDASATEDASNYDEEEYDYNESNIDESLDL